MTHDPNELNRLPPRLAPLRRGTQPTQRPVWDSPIIRRALAILFLTAVGWAVVWLGVDPDTIPWPPAP